MKKRLLPLAGLTLLSCVSGAPGAEAPAWRLTQDTPVFTKTPDVFEDNGIGSPQVLVEGSGSGRSFVLVYAQGATDGPVGAHYGRIGRATSADGVTWKRTGDHGVVLEPAFGTDRFDSGFLDTPCHVKVGGTFHLYYFGDRDNNIAGGQIGLATSTDGVHFTRQGTEPVLPVGPSGSWDDLWVESPEVIHDGRQFVMYYTGGRDLGRPLVGRAVSPDGIVWTKDPAAPVLAEGSGWDGLSARVPGLVFRGGVFELYYCSQSVLEAQLGWLVPQVGLATSTDGVHFTRSPRNPLVGPGHLHRAAGGPYNPCVYLDPADGTLHMLVESGLGFFALEER